MKDWWQSVLLFDNFLSKFNQIIFMAYDESLAEKIEELIKDNKMHKVAFSRNPEHKSL